MIATQEELEDQIEDALENVIGQEDESAGGLEYLKDAALKSGYVAPKRLHYTITGENQGLYRRMVHDTLREQLRENRVEDIDVRNFIEETVMRRQTEIGDSFALHLQTQPRIDVPFKGFVSASYTLSATILSFSYFYIESELLTMFGVVPGVAAVSGTAFTWGRRIVDRFSKDEKEEVGEDPNDGLLHLHQDVRLVYNSAEFNRYPSEVFLASQ